MADLNTVALIGRLTRDPELKVTPSAISVVTLTLAVERMPNKSGEKEADFIDCVLWGKLAEISAKYLEKGKRAAVHGRIQTRTYETKDGQKRKVFEVVCDQVQFLSPKSKQTANEDLDDGPPI